MMKKSVGVITLLLLPLSALAGDAPLDPLDQWPQWRGPLQTGVAPRADPPVAWGEDHNVRWKLALPGTGHSTPIVWGDRVFLTAAVPFGDRMTPPEEHDHGAHDNSAPDRRRRFVVLAVDRRSGKVVWERAVKSEQPHEGTHETGSWASNSAVTDGEHIFAFFGSRGLFALDLSGAVVWEKDFGDMRTRHGHGEGSSPALHGDTLVINWDHQGDSFVVALDKRTGKERWRSARDEITSWSTPLVVEHDGRAQVVISATKRVRSYDLVTGAVIWEVSGLSRNVVASPVAGDGLVIVGASYDWQAMMAIRLAAARGDVTGTGAVVWSRDRGAPYVPSPLLYDGMLYFLNHSQGLLNNLDAKTGEPHYGPLRIRAVRNVFASPLGAGGRIYVLSREGMTAVLTHGAEPQLLALNQLDDVFSASPAAVGRELFLRGQRSLYCIAEDGAKAAVEQSYVGGQGKRSQWSMRRQDHSVRSCSSTPEASGPRAAS